MLMICWKWRWRIAALLCNSGEGNTEENYPTADLQEGRGVVGQISGPDWVPWPSYFSQGFSDQQLLRHHQPQAWGGCITVYVYSSKNPYRSLVKSLSLSSSFEHLFPSSNPNLSRQVDSVSQKACLSPKVDIGFQQPLQRYTYYTYTLNIPCLGQEIFISPDFRLYKNDILSKTRQ